MKSISYIAVLGLAFSSGLAQGNPLSVSAQCEADTDFDAGGKGRTKFREFTLGLNEIRKVGILLVDDWASPITLGLTQVGHSEDSEGNRSLLYGFFLARNQDKDNYAHSDSGVRGRTSSIEVFKYPHVPESIDIKYKIYDRLFGSEWDLLRSDLRATVHLQCSLSLVK